MSEGSQQYGMRQFLGDLVNSDYVPPEPETATEVVEPEPTPDTGDIDSVILKLAGNYKFLLDDDYMTRMKEAVDRSAA